MTDQAPATASQVPLLNPSQIELTDRKGVKRAYILSEIPCTYSREIVALYPTSALPKVGDYGVNEQMMFKLMSYVAVPMPNGVPPLRLVTRDLLHNHVPDLRTLANLEKAMAQYNWDFFLPDDLSSFWGRIKVILSTFIRETLTDSLRQSSQTAKPPSQS